MNENPRDPNARPALDELEGAPRRAVEAARAAPVPEEALARSLDRACRLAVSANGHPRKYTRGLFAVGALAASLLVGTLLWVGFHGGPAADRAGPGETVALMDRGAALREFQLPRSAVGGLGIDPAEAAQDHGRPLTVSALERGGRGRRGSRWPADELSPPFAESCHAGPPPCRRRRAVTPAVPHAD